MILKNYIRAIIFLALAALSGVLFYLIQSERMIICWSHSPEKKSKNSLFTGFVQSHKTIKIWYFKDRAFSYDTVSLMWDEQDLEKNLQHIINQWLSVLSNERIITFQVMLEHVLVAGITREAVLCLDKSFLPSQKSILFKWLLVRSLCKTIKDSGLPVDYITLLVNKKPLQDDHLDCSCPLSVQDLVDTSVTI